MQVVLASSNRGKLQELSSLLGGLNLSLAPQSDFAVTPCDEPFESFLENALAKARHASACTGLPALADDSGLLVDELRDWAGVRSA
ncbi:MAG TPA: non-canonical purine NTP pyrophosphatase, partial [Burkholderiales bacterium]|nr:non-canonical purine NTP pyrophosphatase [Burkholderiales bacterium]